MARSAIDRTPTALQKLACASYCFFIFFFAALNVALLCGGPWVRLAWLA
jgi:hypothetical protein